MTDVAVEADQLATAATKAEERAQAARAKAAEAAQRAEEARQKTIARIRRRRLDEFDAAALMAEELDAERRFRAAVLDGGDSVGAFVAWQVAAQRRHLLATEAEAARAALEPDQPPLAPTSPASRPYAEAVQAVVDHAIANQAEDLRDQLQAELDNA